MVNVQKSDGTQAGIFGSLGNEFCGRSNGSIVNPSSLKALAYLATPYSHSTLATQFQRHILACQVAGALVQQGHLVFCPIAHSHAIGQVSDIGGTWELWQTFCTEMVERCDELWIATISGWKDSKGIAAETAIAHDLGKPIYLLNPDTLIKIPYFL
jgi:Domain of unknown function (DUF1937)